jgi:hypothetical protein
MRALRSVALLLIAAAAFAAQKPDDAPSFSRQPKTDWKTQLRAPDGSFQFRTLPDSAQLRYDRSPTLERYFPGGNTCYFIRSYAVKRVDGTDETVPAGVTTCTPASRFRLRRSAPRK